MHQSPPHLTLPPALTTGKHLTLHIATATAAIPGGYDKEEKAARAYDMAALKYWGTSSTTNFPISNYEKELEEMKHMTRQEFVASIRRKVATLFEEGSGITSVWVWMLKYPMPFILSGSCIQKNQLVNQSTYAKLGCTQGWFMASLFHPSSR